MYAKRCYAGTAGDTEGETEVSLSMSGTVPACICLTIGQDVGARVGNGDAGESIYLIISVRKCGVIIFRMYMVRNSALELFLKFFQ